MCLFSGVFVTGHSVPAVCDVAFFIVWGCVCVCVCVCVCTEVMKRSSEGLLNLVAEACCEIIISSNWRHGWSLKCDSLFEFNFLAVGVLSVCETHFAGGQHEPLTEGRGWRFSVVMIKKSSESIRSDRLRKFYVRAFHGSALLFSAVSVFKLLSGSLLSLHTFGQKFWFCFNWTTC